MVEALTFLHLLGAFLFVGGSVLATVLRVAAMGREQPADVALLLRAVRPAVPLIGAGLVVSVIFGAWLVEEIGFDWGSTWLGVTFALIAWMLVVGAVAGRGDRQTRELAERLASEGSGRSDELRARLRDPVNLALNGSMIAATAAVIAMMVFRPA